jgi:hypothetical protein
LPSWHHRRVLDVRRVQADLVDTSLDGGQSKSWVEVDIGNQRYDHLSLDGPQSPGRFHILDCETNEFTSMKFQFMDLADGGRDITGIRLGHRLHDDGMVATHNYGSDLDHARHPTFHS